MRKMLERLKKLGRRARKGNAVMRETRRRWAEVAKVIEARDFQITSLINLLRKVSPVRGITMDITDYRRKPLEVFFNQQQIKRLSTTELEIIADTYLQIKKAEVFLVRHYKRARNYALERPRRFAAPNVEPHRFNDYPPFAASEFKFKILGANNDKPIGIQPFVEELERRKKESKK